MSSDDPAEYANVPQPTRPRKLRVRLRARWAFSRLVTLILVIPTFMKNSPPCLRSAVHRGGQCGGTVAETRSQRAWLTYGQRRIAAPSPAPKWGGNDQPEQGEGSEAVFLH